MAPTERTMRTMRRRTLQSRTSPRRPSFRAGACGCCFAAASASFFFLDFAMSGHLSLGIPLEEGGIRDPGIDDIKDEADEKHRRHVPDDLDLSEARHDPEGENRGEGGGCHDDPRAEGAGELVLEL